MIPIEEILKQMATWYQSHNNVNFPIIFHHKVREWKAKPMVNQIPIKIQNTSFFPLYEIPKKLMHKLVIRYQLRNSSIETI